MNRRLLRKIKNAVFLLLSLIATMVGLACLAAILWTLLSHGIAGMSGHLFTQMTPPPGAAGGLLNAIFGSAVMTLIGIAVGGNINGRNQAQFMAFRIPAAQPPGRGGRGGAPPPVDPAN